MKRIFSLLTILLLGTLTAGAVQQQSVYTQKPDDPEALCLQLSGECYRDALKGEEAFCELFIRKWCGVLAG